jgi:hypothetical protein
VKGHPLINTVPTIEIAPYIPTDPRDVPMLMEDAVAPPILIEEASCPTLRVPAKILTVPILS